MLTQTRRRVAETAAEYGRLKRELAGRLTHDRVAYTDAKTAFIRDIVARAERAGRLAGEPDHAREVAPVTHELSYDDTTALLVVDVQNDFADPKGNLYVAGGEQTLPYVNEQVERARDGGAAVVYTQDWHPKDTPHFAKDGGTWPVHCVMGTWGAELHPDLRVQGPVVRKGSNGEDGYSGFMMRDPETGAETPTELDGLLVRNTVGRVVVVGLAQDVCVKATALDAVERGYHVDVPAAGTRAVNLQEGDDERAWQEVRDAGAHVL